MLELPKALSFIMMILAPYNFTMELDGMILIDLLFKQLVELYLPIQIRTEINIKFIHSQHLVLL